MNDIFIQIFEKVRNTKKGQLMNEFILGLDIDNVNNDYIDYYLNYWILYECGFGNGKNTIEIDKLWMEDERVKEYYNSNHADTIFSVFTPLKKCIELIGKGIYNKNINDLIIIKENKNIWFNKNNNLYKALNNFAKEACTIGNMINYPYLKNEVNFNSYRGLTYKDLFLHSLYECFDNGKFSSLFSEKSNYNTIEEWISKNELGMFFENNVIKKDKIKNIGIQDKTNINWNNVKTISNMINILNQYTEIIKVRNGKLINVIFK